MMVINVKVCYTIVSYLYILAASEFLAKFPCPTDLFTKYSRTISMVFLAAEI